MFKFLAVFSALPLLIYAFSTGPLPRKTAVPGEGVCTECHTGTALNGGGGKVEIAFPSGLTYSPGVTQRLTITITDTAAKVYGFQLTARLASDEHNGQAGDLNPVPGDAVFVLCSDNSPKAAGGCPASAPIQSIEHNAPHTSNVIAVDWTPPAQDQGPVHIYVAANAANGDGTPNGDHIYAAHYTLTAASAPSNGPQTVAHGAAALAAAFLPAIAPNAWVAVSGSNLAPTTRFWRANEIVNGVLPTSLDGVKVTINGKPAAVSFISPAQLNVLAPDDNASGTVEVQVETEQGKTKTTAVMQPVVPGLFPYYSDNGNPADAARYLAAQHGSDFSILAKPGLFRHATSTPGKPGEVIVLYGTGFGGTNPPLPPGRLVTQAAPLAKTVTALIGNLPAEVQFAGVIQAGLCQFNVKIPDGVPDGDAAVVLSMDGLRTQDNAFITIQQ